MNLVTEKEFISVSRYIIKYIKSELPIMKQDEALKWLNWVDSILCDLKRYYNV